MEPSSLTWPPHTIMMWRNSPGDKSPFRMQNGIWPWFCRWHSSHIHHLVSCNDITQWVPQICTRICCALYVIISYVARNSCNLFTRTFWSCFTVTGIIAMNVTWPVNNRDMSKFDCTKPRKLKSCLYSFGHNGLGGFRNDCTQLRRLSQ